MLHFSLPIDRIFANSNIDAVNATEISYLIMVIACHLITKRLFKGCKYFLLWIGEVFLRGWYNATVLNDFIVEV
jgi:hypothetical protein